MNIPSECEHPQCNELAVHVVLDKTTGKITYRCANMLHMGIQVEHTYSIFSAKDYSQRRIYSERNAEARIKVLLEAISPFVSSSIFRACAERVTAPDLNSDKEKKRYMFSGTGITWTQADARNLCDAYDNNKPL